MAEARAAHHDPVHAVAVEHLLRALRGIDVAVADDGNVHPGIVLDFADEGPVGLALVHLAAGAAVDGEGLDAHVLQPFGEVHDDLGAVVPAQAGLHRDGCLDGFHDGFRDGDELVRLAHHAAAGAPARDLGHRAAPVDVDRVGPVPAGELRRAVGHPGRIDHRLGDVPVDLDRDGGLLLERAHLGDGLRGVADEPVRGDELGRDHRRPGLAAQDAEGRVRHVLHRRQHHGALAQVDVRYLHGGAKIRKK